MTTSAVPELRPVLSYHDYVLLVAGLDAEWTRKQQYNQGSGCRNAFKRVFSEFTEIATGVRKQLEDGFEAAYRAKPDEAWRQQLAGLYEPVHYLPVGHADALSFVLLDDFDPAHEVTARCSTTIEEIGVGLCPRIRELIVTHGKSDDTPPQCFVEPHEMAALCREGTPSRPPLMMLIRFKLNGWGALSFGLLFQAALLRAIVTETEETVRFLKAQVGEQNEKRLKAFEIGEQDIGATKFCALDMLGQEELALWCVTTNYSIPMAILARIQAITIADVFDCDATEQLKSSFGAAPWFKSICKFQRDVAPANGDKPEGNALNSPDDLKDCHIFRWTRSTLGVTLEAYENPQAVRGYVHAVSVLQTATGHHQAVDSQLDELANDFSPTYRVPELPRFRLYAMGQGDLLVHHSGFRCRTPDLLVHARTFFHQVGKCMEKFVGESRERRGQRDLVGLSSVAGVPVPEMNLDDGDDYLCAKVRLGHVAVIEQLLPALRWRIAPDGKRSGNQRLSQGCTLGERSAGLSLDEIRMRPLLYSLPASLIHSLEFLYQNYATLLANPFVFDSVLDLYDAFSTLHRMLTDVLPEAATEVSRRPRLHHTKVDELAQFVGTLHRALEHRLYRAYPEELHRDMDIDFRGGLNQLLFAADSVLKCGVGVLRNVVLKDCRHRRDTVGVVMRVAFQPGIWAIKLNLAPETNVHHRLAADSNQGSGNRPLSARLAMIATDVPHIHHVPSYLDFLHESFHLIYDELRDPSRERDDELEPKPFDLLPTVVPGSLLDDRLSEIFVNLLTALFVSRDEPEVVARHYFMQYSASPWPGSANEPETIRHFVEVASYAFMAPFALKLAAPPGQENNWWANEDSEAIGARIAGKLGDPVQVWQDFQEFLKRSAGPLFSEWSTYWESEDALLQSGYWEFTEGVFRDYYRAVRQFVPTLLKAAQRIFLNYAKQVLNRSESREKPLNLDRWQHIEHSADRFFEENAKHGRPLPLTLWRRKSDSPDAMLAVARQLRHTIKHRNGVILQNPAKQRFLPPINENGQPQFDASKDYNEFLIHPGSSSFWCCIPEKRRMRLAHQITALKTFWDVSTDMRASRFGEMLERNLSVQRAQ